jgi:HlyD family secretion protein
MKANVQWRRRVVLSLIGVLVVWGLFQGFRPQPIEVDLGRARRAPMRITIEQEGRTRVVDRFVINAPVNGYARRIKLDVGDTVKRGDTLALLEPPRAEILDVRRHAGAEARIAAAKDGVNAAEQRSKAAASSAELAQKELLRVRALRLVGYVSATAEDRAANEAERSAADLRSAQYAVAIARHEFEAARIELKYGASRNANNLVPVRAPIAGKVLTIMHKSEGTVVAGQPLIEIGDPRSLEVEVDVLTADAVSVQPGTRVLFERWGGDGTLEGVVRKVEPGAFTKVSALGVEEQRVWIIVAIISPREQWQRLGDGYRVEATFIIWEAKDVLQIPASALFREGDGWDVFVVEQGKATKRNVTIGQRNGLYAQVVSGINEGESVIVHPDDRVREGVTLVTR